LVAISKTLSFRAYSTGTEPVGEPGSHEWQQTKNDNYLTILGGMEAHAHRQGTGSAAPWQRK
jgi:hypothetical protein